MYFKTAYVQCHIYVHIYMQYVASIIIIINIIIIIIIISIKMSFCAISLWQREIRLYSTVVPPHSQSILH